ARADLLLDAEDAGGAEPVRAARRPAAREPEPAYAGRGAGRAALLAGGLEPGAAALHGRARAAAPQRHAGVPVPAPDSRLRGAIVSFRSQGGTTMTPRRLAVAATVLTSLSTPPSFAAYYFEARSTGDDAGAAGAVTGWIDAGKARIEFRDGGAAMF